jgi:hypothetical protein
VPLERGGDGTIRDADRGGRRRVAEPRRQEDHRAMPQRVQLSRRKGWRKPEGTVTVARPGYWGNPFVIGETPRQHRERDRGLWEHGGLSAYDDEHPLTRAEAVAAYRAWVPTAVGRSGRLRVEEARDELRGADLACWCPLGGPCHAEVLLEVANAGDA